MSDQRIKGGPGHGMTWDEFNAKFGNRIASLESLRRSLEGRVHELERQLAKDGVTARHFEMLMEAVNSNPLVKKEWERFMMTLRMVGMDGTGDQA